MKLWHALCGTTLLALFSIGAMAQEDPEAVYAKLHRATLAGNTDEVLSFGTAAARAELAAKPKAEKDAIIGALAQVLPKTYSITEKTIAPDGNSAILRGTGVSEFLTRSDSYLSATFKKEDGVWKVSTWGWSNQKPPPATAKAPPAAATPATPAAAVDPAYPPQTVRRMAATAAVAVAAEKTAVPAPAKTRAATGPSRAHLDARLCLRQPTDRAVMACAEKYR